jgi:hypothetical protein
MKKILAIVVLGFLLQGCAPTLDATAPGQAIIKNCTIYNQAEALQLAQKHCEGQNKNAVKTPDDRADGLCYYECKAK